MDESQWLICLNAADDGADESGRWIMLMPARGLFQGIDGRRFYSPGAAALIAAHRALPDVVVDVNHGSIRWSADASAAGWIGQLEDRDGALWGHVAWTQRGRRIIEDRAYRYYSPTYVSANGVVARIHSVGLVNTPNLIVDAVNRQEVSQVDEAKRAAVAAALNLEPSSTNEQIAEAIGIAAAAPAATTDMVPRATHALAEQRAQNAERELAEMRQAGHDAEAKAAVADAVSRGVVAPADEEYFLQSCADAAGLERFRKWSKDRPPAMAQTQRRPGAAPAGQEQKPELSPEQREVNRQMLGVEDPRSAAGDAGRDYERVGRGVIDGLRNLFRSESEGQV